MTAPAGWSTCLCPTTRRWSRGPGWIRDAEAARVAGADPGTVAGAGALFGRAGGEMDAALHGQPGRRGQDRAGVHQRRGAGAGPGTHMGEPARGLRRRRHPAGRDVAPAGRRGRRPAATMQQTADAVTGPGRRPAAAASPWAARVAAAGTDGRVDPAGGDPRAAGRAGPDRRADGRPGRRAGRQVVDRIRGYEVVINEALRLLADHGFVAAGRAGRRPRRRRPRAAVEGVDPPGSAPR